MSSQIKTQTPILTIVGGQFAPYSDNPEVNLERYSQKIIPVLNKYFDQIKAHVKRFQDFNKDKGVFVIGCFDVREEKGKEHVEDFMNSVSIPPNAEYVINFASRGSLANHLENADEEVYMQLKESPNALMLVVFHQDSFDCLVLDVEAF